MIVYFHRNPVTNEVFYVGIGVNEGRAYRLKGKHRNRFWHNYVSKHGIPIVEIVHHVETRKEAVELELKYIAQFGRRCDGSGCLVNITIGGDGGMLGAKQDASTVQKRREKLTGFVHSEESKMNMRQAQNRPEVKQKISSYQSVPEVKAHQRKFKIGKKLSEATKQKISNANLGRKVNLETRMKISASNTGKVRSVGTKAKYAAAKLGTKQSEEVKQKRANACKKVLLNTQTGVFYHGFHEAAQSVPMKVNTLRSRLSGHLVNNTPFVYA